ncbi:hypothetical protein SmJEL517_g03058 [Synchytrium microbalum]|uniref:Uncharacterized protein n=1 Tax=Synchytrium microbalum TaxID=1806994 RepID=A0A507BZG9_9FUNG|nr:uncharacterized protein SmJEL517_g03058 [Synchytrium microbalum]TPX34197.1 hypothetical protein SmJEL517_g03058 [Synchytrium microbalum]
MSLLSTSREAQKLGGTSPQAIYVATGFGAAGVFVRIWALGLQGRPISSRPHIHALFFAAFAGLGVLVHNFERSQLDKLEFERDKLVKRRMMRLAAAEQ